MPKGIYVCGTVGGGKTMLMDMFYDTLEGRPRVSYSFNLPLLFLGMAIRNPSPTNFLDQKRIRNLNCEFGLLILTTFVALKQNLIFTVSVMLILG